MTSTGFSLGAFLKEKICSEGPLSVSDYVKICLQDPQGGYYTCHGAIGHEGDFLTAPEVSPLFGEMVGAWLLLTWEEMGRPPFRLVELGPGKGTLMKDILRTSQVVPAFRKACVIHFIEVSPFFQKLQQEVLKAYPEMVGSWHVSLEDLPSDLPLFFVANEFFDALPFHQFIYTSEGWRERKIGWQEPEGFTWEISSTAPSSGILRTFLHQKESLVSPFLGACAEVSEDAILYAQELRQRLLSQGGAGLIIDYGYVQGYGDTFQALSTHSYASVFQDPGRVDLTAHVDFGALHRVFSFPSLRIEGPFSQRHFLKTFCIEERAQFLKKKSPHPDGIEQGLQRLISPDQMGELFRVLSIVSR